MKVRLLPTETDSAPAMGLEESWLAVLGELAGISQTATQLAEFAHSAAERVRSLVGADYSLVHWWDSNRQSLRVVARSGNAGEVRSRGVGADELARSCFAQGELLTVEDLGTNGRKAASAAHGGLISVPLTLEGKAIGVLTLGSRARAWTPSRRDRELLRLIAAQIAPSMHAAKLIETSRAQAERFRVLHEVAVAAGGMLD
ncbi:MAG TPA: GAF domain-containing protein, partial [Candidatus Dormibacteraeota bacterium]|nr:GAF domain-containing protein [Candidatus Dormibacteraeota bacterium]